MSAPSTLEEAIAADAFPEVDMALRRGRHIDREEIEAYSYLLSAQERLEDFYRRYGCELVHRNEGYFYLLPTTERLGRRHLSSGEMLVGQALTLLFLEPSTLEKGPVVTREQVLAQLATVMGSEALVRAMNPKRRRVDERAAEETVRQKVSEALRRLAALGFVDLIDDGQARLRPALMRFAEPLRGADSPEQVLEQLAAAGELVLTDTSSEEGRADATPEDMEDEG